MMVSDTMSVSIHVLGDEEPSIVFVHGGLCDRLDWSAQIDALAPRFRCISFDLPGHGASAIPQVISVVALADSVAEITRRVNRPAIMVGHSLGCALILEAYRRAPERVAGVVLLDGGLVGDGDPARAVKLTQDMLEVLGLNQFVARSFGAMFGSGSPQDLKNQVLSRAMRMDPEFSRQLLLSIAAWGRDDAGRALPLRCWPTSRLPRTTRASLMAIRAWASPPATMP